MPFNLILENDKNDLAVYTFESNLITVGRAKNNDFVLDERNISRHHLRLQLADGRIIIEDQGSYNGTFVNGREINQKVEIFAGDVIALGDFNIYFEQEASIDQKPVKKEIKSAPQKSKDDVLLVKTGSLGGKVFPVKGVETAIGSHAGADVYLFGHNIPEVHSKIIFDGRVNLLIRHDKNKNMPLIVNGMKVESIDVRHGDEITIGDNTFEYIEKGKEFDPAPYILKAEEERRKKLLDELDHKKIKSLHDVEDEDNEKTEITKIPKVKQKKNLMPLFVGAGLFVLVLVAIIIFLISKG